MTREVIGAHYGTRDWLAQRVTAVVMALYTLFFVAVLTSLPQRDYEHWSALWALPVMRFATVLFVLSTLIHAWIGVRNIFMDYVHNMGLRLTLHVVVILTLIAYGVWAVQILWSV